MMNFDQTGTALDRLMERSSNGDKATILTPQFIAAHSRELLTLAESVLSNWVLARGDQPAGTSVTHEGFHMLALHRQGVKGDPSFNACRETCREIAWHFNLLALHTEPVDQPTAAYQLQMMGMLVRHLLLFVSGKCRESALGEFCCASRPLRTNEQPTPDAAASTDVSDTLSHNAS